MDISSFTCIKLRYFVHDTGLENQNKFCGLSIFLRDNTNKASQYRVADALYGWKLDILAPGWHTVSFASDNPTWQQSGFDITKLRLIEMQIVLRDAAQQYTGADGLVITFDLLEFFTPISTAQYALTFDDGFADQYDIAAYLTAKGLRATFYITPGKIDSDPNRLTLEQLKIMHDNGHLIANHTWSHQKFKEKTTGEVLMTMPEYIREVTKAAEWLYANGFGDGARILAQPWGTGYITEEAIDAVLGKYVDQIRLTGKPINREYIDYDPGRLYANGTTGEIGDTVLAAAIRDSSLGIFFTHSLSSGMVREAKLAHFDAVAEAVENGQVEVVTMDELLEPSRY